MLIDNYDSFTYILHHYLLQLHPDVRVFRNDGISVPQLLEMNPQRIIISPGPQTPDEAGITMDVISAFHGQIPILGVCLGHQALGQFFGASVQRGSRPVHGSTSAVQHRQEHIFQGIPPGFQAMRYHSLIVCNWEQTALQPLGFTDDGVLMAFRHPIFPVTGLQFHPESVLTEHGLHLLRNWRDCYAGYDRAPGDR